MSRTVAAQNSQNDSFVELLDRMTRSGQSGQSESAGRNLAGKRPMATVTEVKPGRGRLAPDTVELSYERALRLHARRVAEDIDFDLPVAAAEERATPLPSRPDAAAQRARGHAAKPARFASAAPKVTPNIGPTTAQSPMMATAANRKRSRVEAKPEKAKTVTAATQLPQRKKSGSTTPARSSAASEIRSEIRRNAKRLAKAGKVALQKVEAAKVLPPQLSREEHRRSIISVRLNEEEFSRLRTRALESGISVSAYMRSCVMDAEHLRAQVKHALAEMRAYTQPQEAVTGPLSGSALSRSVKGTAETGSRWSRFVSFSATFFLGPFLASRRRV